MRDPVRIDKVLAVLRAAWQASPDQRLTQLVANAANVAGEPGNYAFSRLYQTEDDDMLLGLAAMAPGAPEGLVSAGSLPAESLGIDDGALFPMCPQCLGSGLAPVLVGRASVCSLCHGRGRKRPS